MMTNNSNSNQEATQRFLALFMQNQKRIYAYILYHVPNMSDAEDLLQEAVTVMLSRFDEYQEGTNFLAWGITIARNKIYAYHRLNKRYKLMFDDADLEMIGQRAIDKIGYIEEQSMALRSCLKKLSSKQQGYLRLRYEFDMTFRDIAKQFSVSMQAAAKTITRIQVTLLKCIHAATRQEGSL